MSHVVLPLDCNNVAGWFLVFLVSARTVQLSILPLDVVGLVVSSDSVAKLRVLRLLRLIRLIKIVRVLKAIR